LPAIRFTPEGLAHSAQEHPEHAHRGERTDAAAEGGSTAGPSGGGRGAGGARAAGSADGTAAHGHGRGAPRARVWMLRDGKLVPVQVRTGLDDGTLIEVAGEDLKEGDVVVVNAVRPNEPKPEGGERLPGTNPNQRPGQGGFRP
jgi:hypothetical protein